MRSNLIPRRRDLLTAPLTRVVLGHRPRRVTQGHAESAELEVQEHSPYTRVARTDVFSPDTLAADAETGGRRLKWMP